MKKSKKQRKLFSPDLVMTRLVKALNRDLDGHNSCIRPDCIAFDYYRKVQKDKFCKKYLSEEVDLKSLDPQTYQKFEEVVLHLEGFDFNLPNVSRLQKRMPWREKALLRARALCHTVLGDWTTEELYLASKHSQGSSIGVPYLDTSLERKFTFPISVTERCKPILQDYLDWDVSLSEAIDGYNGPFTICDKYNVVSGSRATTVPKTNEINRMIAIEPTGNMYFQQGLMTMLYDRLACFGLDVTTLPEKHKILAREGSVTGNIATIDFSSASDCVSIKLLEWLLPPRWFALIWALRADRMAINGHDVNLPMISTMGNAGTFPLELLVFWSLASAAISTNEDDTATVHIAARHRNKASVFGDDCIVPTEHAQSFMDLARSVGFLVNEEKSFFTRDSYFRESCGGDYFHGSDVRPFYLKAPTSHSLSALAPWLYIIFNGLQSKYISYFGPLNYIYSAGVFREIFDVMREHGIKPHIVPSDFPDDAGLKLGHDLLRYVANYDLEFMKLYRSHHGSVTFNYTHFVYNTKAIQVCGDIRYFVGLKRKLPLSDVMPYILRPKKPLPEKWVLHNSRFTKTFRRRNQGSYVVAKAQTGHWPAIDGNVAGLLRTQNSRRPVKGTN